MGYKYSPMEIEEIYKVYKPSGHVPSVASRMLGDITGRTVSAQLVTYYWKKKKYKIKYHPREGKSPVSRKKFVVDDKLRKRILYVLASADNVVGGEFSVTDIARRCRVPARIIRELRSESRRASQADLESRVDEN